MSEYSPTEYVLDTARTDVDSVAELLMEYVRVGYAPYSNDLTNIVMALEGDLMRKIGVRSIQFTGIGNRFVLVFGDDSRSTVDVDPLMAKTLAGKSLWLDAINIFGMMNAISLYHHKPSFLTREVMKRLGVRVKREYIERRTAMYSSGCYVVDSNSRPVCRIRSLCTSHERATATWRSVWISARGASAANNADGKHSSAGLPADVEDCHSGIVSYVPRPRGTPCSDNCDSACTSMLVRMADVTSVPPPNNMENEYKDKTFVTNHRQSKYRVACLKFDASANAHRAVEATGGSGASDAHAAGAPPAGADAAGGDSRVSAFRAGILTTSVVLLGSSLAVWMANGN